MKNSWLLSFAMLLKCKEIFGGVFLNYPKKAHLLLYGKSTGQDKLTLKHHCKIIINLQPLARKEGGGPVRVGRYYKMKNYRFVPCFVAPQ